MYAGFEKHKTFDAYKTDYLKLSRDKAPASDFVLRECWIGAVPPWDVDSDIFAMNIGMQPHGL